MEYSILIVEDEEKISRILEIELKMEGYLVGRANNGTDGLERYRAGHWDLVLLDIMLPGMSGIELLRRIRVQDTQTPVILLTAKSSVEDKVSGLDLGANDYITKPFEIEELFARIRATLRQRTVVVPKAVDEGWLCAAGLKVNEGTREVIRGNERISLMPREFDLLVYLLKNKRQVLNRKQILVSVWGLLRLVLAAVTAVALLPAILSSRVLGTLITKPISSMTHTMREIQDSCHFKRLELVDSSEDELVEMGDTFNHMMDLLESNYKKQEQFVSNASHELKTPLTVIENYANLRNEKGWIALTYFVSRSMRSTRRRFA